MGGIDLSQTTDLTAASVVIQKDGTLYAFTQFFMPRGRLEYLQATDGVPYDIFVKKGLITLSGENYVDYHDVYGWFTMLLEDYGIRPLKIGYDRYSAQYLMGKNVETVEDDVLPSWDDANEGDVIAVFMNFSDYVINTNMEMQVVKWTDHDNNKIKNKCLMVVDGKVADAAGIILVKKGVTAV